MPLHLSRATPADAPGVAAVYVGSWNAAFADLMPVRVLDGRQIARWEQDLASTTSWWWVATSATHIVGLAGTGPSRDPRERGLGELDTIAVLPTWWRLGVGRLLMGAAVGDLVRAGYEQAILWTPAAHIDGLAFYAAQGWSPSGEVRDGDGDGDGDGQLALRRKITG